MHHMNQLNVDDRVLEFFHTFTLNLVTRIEREGLPASGKFFDQLMAATTSFGMAERNFRKAGRISAAGLSKQDAATAQQTADRLHASGLIALKDLSTTLDSVMTEWDPYHAQKKEDRKRACDEFSATVLRGLVDTELKPSDVGELKDALATITKAMTGTKKELAAFLSKTVAEYEALRNKPDRGTVPNIMPWKILALCLIGVGIIIVQLIIVAFGRGGGAAVGAFLTGLGGLGGWIAVALLFC